MYMRQVDNLGTSQHSVLRYQDVPVAEVSF